MGWLGESPYNCPECDGEGETCCPTCGCEEIVCDRCEGTGWDPEQIDVSAFKAAVEKIQAELKASDSGVLGWEWIEVKGEIRNRIGRGFPDRPGVRASDFAWED